MRDYCIVLDIASELLCTSLLLPHLIAIASLMSSSVACLKGGGRALIPHN